MIPYGRQFIDRQDIAAVVRAMRSDWLTQGPMIKKFEAALCRHTGARYAVAVSNGTAALHLSYLAAGLKAGDEVITTPNTFVATTNMLMAIGAKPVFCDIRLDTYNINEQAIEPLITKRTRAIVPVHFAGQPADLRPIWRLARKHHLIVIEDAAHALGANYQGKKVGGLASDLTIFSFHPVKTITTGEGGAVLTNKKHYYKKLMLLRSHGIIKDRDGFNVMHALGYNYRLTDLQAALGLSQLFKLNTFITKRQQVARWWKDALRGVDEIILPLEVPGTMSSWHLYVIRLKDPQLRLPLIKYLRQKDIATNWHYPAVYRHPYYRKHGYARTTLPNVEAYHATALSLPCYVQLKRVQVQTMAKHIKIFFSYL